MTRQSTERRNLSRQRRGIATLKIILLLPVAFILLCLVLEVGNLWLARLELENALESAALAAVKEWGDANGAYGTWIPRQVGNEFGRSNTVTGIPMDLSLIDPNLNFDDSDPDGNPNQNATCPEGVLIFGAITSFDPEVVFDECVRPSCFGGDLLFDATSQGNMCEDNSWGVSFRASEDSFLNENLLVTRIIIDVDPFNTAEAYFDFGTPSNPQPPVLSDNLPQPKIHDEDPTPPNSQPDNFGFVGAPGQPLTQIFFSPTVGSPTQLEITFGPDGNDAGFSPGDRFRFGACVRRRRGNGGHYAEASGDDIGQIPTKVTVFFELAGQPIPVPAEGYFFDNAERGLDGHLNCNKQGIPYIDPLGNFHLIVHGRQIVDLPCPATSAANNNGQSFVELSGDAERPFAVRAQAQMQVRSVFDNLFGCHIGPFSVSAKATAYYCCRDRRPCLIRIDRFLCCEDQ